MVELKKVSTDKAPAAIGPYSQAIVCGNMVFTSGQIPINPASGNVEATTIEGQAEQVMKNLGEVLTAAGSGFEKTVKTAISMASSVKALTGISRVSYSINKEQKICTIKL